MTFWFKIRLTIFFVLFVPISGWSAQTDFYMTSTGSNLNSGSTAGSPVYSSTGGDWVNSTRTFTPNDGVNPVSAGAAVGMFASVYVTAGATVTAYVGRLTTVTNATNGTLVIDATANYGTDPANSSGAHTMTIVVGGAWKGPGAAVTFPFGLSGTLGVLLDTSGDRFRLNAKNDQTYSMTVALSFAALSVGTLQGYTTNVNDGGKAVFTSNIVSGANFQTGSGSGHTFIDLIFANTGGSSTNAVFTCAQSGVTFFRCVFHGGRGSGLSMAVGSAVLVIESEAYDNNKSNSASCCGGFSSGSSSVGAADVLINCYSHDNTAGANAHGFYATGNGMVLINCIAESNGGSGYVLAGASLANTAPIVNCNFYNNTGDGIRFNTTGTAAFAYIVNNNFLKNGGKGINNTLTAQPGIIYNNGRGAGTQANGSADTLAGIVDSGTDVTYANDITPWKAPLTGDFSTVWTQSTATGAGRGVFTETGSGVTPTPTPTASGTPTPKIGTVGFPDIGAAQAPSPTSTPSPTPTDTPTPTPTATATASFTPCAATPGPTATSTPTATATPTAPIEVSYGFTQ